MKKSIIVVISTLIFCSQLYSQTYESLFGTSSTKWNSVMGNLWGQGTDEHIIEGDTLINGISYKVIGGYSVSGFKGFIREDTNEGKAWYRNNQDTTEYLIMDLELNLGDSMYIGGNWNPYHGYYKVDSIYFSNNRKYVQLNYDLFFMIGEKLTLIEGVSSNLGFRFQDEDYMNNFNPYLLCSYKDGIQEFGVDNCFLTSTESNESDYEIKIYPNPFQNRITVFNSKANEMECNIFNQGGSLVKSYVLNRKENILENLENLNEEIYFIVIVNKEKQILKIEKIIKLD